jgi:hypothetical protein
VIRSGTLVLLIFLKKVAVAAWNRKPKGLLPLAHCYGKEKADAKGKGGAAERADAGKRG